MKKLLLIAAAITLVAAPGIARADLIGVTGFTGGNAFTSFSGGNVTVGFRFTPTAALSITELGLFDPSARGTPLTHSHDVGLWDSSGTLLASTTIDPTGLTVDSFYYDAITPVALAANAIYTIGALYSPGQTTPDVYLSSVSNLTVSPDITFNGAAVTNGATLTDPVTTSATVGRFGPNFQYTLTSVDVPEPATLLLLGSGLAGLGLYRRQRTQIKA